MAQLGDLLSGMAGRPVDRIGLESAVMQGQAMSGLRSAQTEEALAKAQETREQQAARDRLGESLFQMLDAQGDVHARVNAQAATDSMIAGFGDAKVAAAAQDQYQKNQAFATVADPHADPDKRMSAAQALNPNEVQFQAVDGQLIPRMQPHSQTAPPTVFQTPASNATNSEHTAQGNFYQAQADNPSAFHPGAMPPGGLPPELQAAVHEGRLDPTRINGRNVAIFSQLAKNDPTLDFNRMHSDAALQSNPTFQQRALVMEGLPEIMSHMTDLGKKVGYNDVNFVGRAQKFMNGELNDPAMEEYMTVRNDALMSIANVMRGVGMSDQAHRAEQEVAEPTLAPAALDGWLRGQNASLQPRLRAVQGITHHTLSPAASAVVAGTAPGTVPAQTVPTGTTPPAPGAGPDPNDPLGIFTK